jgi:hypothetical protein
MQYRSRCNILNSFGNTLLFRYIQKRRLGKISANIAFLFYKEIYNAPLSKTLFDFWSKISNSCYTKMYIRYESHLLLCYRDIIFVYLIFIYHRIYNTKYFSLWQLHFTIFLSTCIKYNSAILFISRMLACNYCFTRNLSNAY